MSADLRQIREHLAIISVLIEHWQDDAEHNLSPTDISFERAAIAIDEARQVIERLLSENVAS